MVEQGKVAAAKAVAGEMSLTWLTVVMMKQKQKWCIFLLNDLVDDGFFCGLCGVPCCRAFVCVFGCIYLVNKEKKERDRGNRRGEKIYRVAIFSSQRG